MLYGYILGEIFCQIVGIIKRILNIHVNQSRHKIELNSFRPKSFMCTFASLFYNELQTILFTSISQKSPPAISMTK